VTGTFKLAAAITNTRFLRVCLLLLVFILQACATTELRDIPEVQSFPGPVEPLILPVKVSDTSLKVMTLNLAHGRGDGFHQLLQSTDTTIGNLDAITVMLNRVQPDVLAMQEADGPSFWSGNFDHVEYLAGQGPFSWSVKGHHARGMGLTYGTALVSSIALHDPQAVTFNPELALTPKGFVVSTISWPGQPDIKLDIVSVHLDFSSESVRRQQASELIAVMQDRGRPMILMGDFNADWNHDASTVRFIANELGLSAYRPEAEGLETFAFRNKRLDWILVSGGLEYNSYSLVSDVVSDHRGVVAELVLNMPYLQTAGY
jgi:endonuclease/exonuclease/phosphatase family metal-dependent hydrolase